MRIAFVAVSLFFVGSGLPACIAAANRQPGSENQAALDESLITHVRNGEADEVRELLKNGADPTAANDIGWTALHYAARHQHLEIMNTLIDSGADVNRKDRHGRTPLLEALSLASIGRRVDGKTIDTLELLLEAGAKPDGRALAAAAWAGSREAADLLLEAGANAADGLVGAAGAGRLEFVKLFLAKGATVNQKSEFGNTPLHAAANRRGELDTARFLLQHGADVNARNDLGKTPLHSAISGDANITMVRLLVEAGAAVNIPDNEGVTPIRRAAIDGETEVYNLLLAANGGVENVACEDRQDTSPKTSEELIADLESRDAATRKAAETALVVRGEKAMPAVLAALKGGEKIEKFKDLFIKMGPAASAALPELEARLDDPQIAFWLITMMEQMKPGHFETLPLERREAAAAAIYRFITDRHEDPMIPGMIAEMFPGVAREASEPYLLKLLRSNNAQHREDTVDGLGISPFATEQLRSELLNVLRNDPDAKIRGKAATALGNPVFHTPEIEATLSEIVANPPPVGPAKPTALIGNQFSEWATVAPAAARSLMKIAPENADDLAETIIDNMTPLLSPINAPGRPAALTIIRALGAPAIPRLIELLDHENADVAISASVALNQIGQPAVPALAVAVREGNGQVTERAANALWWIGRGAKAALPALLEVAASKDRSDLSRLAPARAALKIDPNVRKSPAILSTIPMLIRVLREGSFRHQGEAAETLGQIGPAAHDALPMLRRRLELPPADFDTGGLVRDYVRRQAEVAISAIQSDETNDK